MRRLPAHITDSELPIALTWPRPCLEWACKAYQMDVVGVGVSADTGHDGHRKCRWAKAGTRRSHCGRSTCAAAFMRASATGIHELPFAEEGPTCPQFQATTRARMYSAASQLSCSIYAHPIFDFGHSQDFDSCFQQCPVGQPFNRAMTTMPIALYGASSHIG